MAQSQTEADDALTDKLRVPAGVSDDDAELFLEGCLYSVRDHLWENREQAIAMTGDDDQPHVNGDVLDPDNLNEIQVRAEPFEAPKLTFWLKDCPMWANDSWRKSLTPMGHNKYNGRVEVVFDVRET